MIIGGILGFGVGWLVIFLWVHLVYNVGWEITYVNPVYIVLGIVVWLAVAPLMSWMSHPIWAMFFKTLGVSMLVTGILYYTMLWIS